MSDQLGENLATFKRLYGSRWPELMAAAIPIAIRMTADKQNPLLLLAVATELAQETNTPDIPQ
jgi:hypothetical protein